MLNLLQTKGSPNNNKVFMKRRFLILITAILIAQSGFACDICGCGVGGYYIGILPEFSQKIMGVRYRYNNLLTHIGANGQTSYLTTDETYRTAELWGGWTLSKKFRVIGYIPVNINEKTNQGITSRKNGLGDIGVQGFYRLINQRKSVGNKLFVHSLWVGAGVKAPTGKYDAEQKNSEQQTANIFQLGTGSTDFTFNAMYDMRLQDAGLNTNISYKVNTKNKNSYQYGNKIGVNLQAYYKFRIKNMFTFAPNTGAMYETSKKDLDKNFSVDISGGDILLGTVGAEISFSKIAIGGNFQHPFQQNLANGFVKAKNRGMIHVSVIL